MIFTSKSFIPKNGARRETTGINWLFICGIHISERKAEFWISVAVEVTCFEALVLPDLKLSALIFRQMSAKSENPLRQGSQTWKMNRYRMRRTLSSISGAGKRVSDMGGRNVGATFKSVKPRLWRNWGSSSDGEPIAEIHLANTLVTDHFIRCSLHEDGAVMNDVGPVDDVECFPHIVIRDQNAEAVHL